MSKFPQKIFLVILGLFLAWAALEGGLRLGGFIYLSRQERRNVEALRRTGACRILCIGESTTAAPLTGPDHSYPAQLEKTLNDSGAGIRFIVINQGRPATDTTAILARIEADLAEYRPDMVVAMMGVNDDGPHMAYAKGTRFLSGLRSYRLMRLAGLRLLTAVQGIRYRRLWGGRPALGGPPPPNHESEAEEWIGRARDYKQSGELPRAEAALEQAIRLNPKDDRAYVLLGIIRLVQVRLPAAEALFKKAISLNPKRPDAYLQLGYYLYAKSGQFPKAESVLRKALAAAPWSRDVRMALAQSYVLQNEPAQADEALAPMVESGGADKSLEQAYGMMMDIGRKTGRKDVEDKYARMLRGFEADSYNPGTRFNYVRLKRILDRRRIKLIAVQYPLRSVRPLEGIFREEPGVVFVDNEEIFKQAVGREGYEKYFKDNFAGDFGHCTPLGNALLAENVARTVLEGLR